ncbi:hypothetical protein BC938DRAFT_478811 [Jimgerdemannia flammicorona]|nr:hypothetical protein BC938DRAFT_478811 [Jimgerdemannia flammicorona]
MKTQLIALLLVSCIISAILDGALAAPAKKKIKKGGSTIIGHAIYVYAEMASDIPVFTKQIKDFNAGASAEHQLRTVIVYAGEVPFDGSKFEPHELFSSTVKGFHNAKLPGVTIHANLDADLGDGGDPILKWSNSKIDSQVKMLCKFICADPNVSGIHLDLEPFDVPYTTKLLRFYTTMSSQLRGSETGCRNAAHPDGREITGYVDNPSAAVFKALGPKGTLIWPGYDCTRSPSSVEAYSKAFRDSMTNNLLDVVKNMPAGQNAKFMIAVPAAATDIEYQHTVKGKQLVASGRKQFSATGPSYITTAVNNVHELVKGYDGYAGMVLWKLSRFYTIGSGGKKLAPAGAFDIPGERDWLKKNL